MSHQQHFRDFLLISLACAVHGLEERTALCGHDAVLPYRYPGNGVVTLLEWMRPDLESLDYVFFYRNARPYEIYQNPSYRGRVALTDPTMKGGDVSIIVKNVSAADSGEYKCRIAVRALEQSDGKIVEFRDVVNLRVADAGQMQHMKTSELLNENDDVAAANFQFLAEKENPPVVIVGVGIFAGLAIVAAVAVGIVKSDKCGRMWETVV